MCHIRFSLRNFRPYGPISSARACNSVQEGDMNNLRIMIGGEMRDQQKLKLMLTLSSQTCLQEIHNRKQARVEVCLLVSTAVDLRELKHDSLRATQIKRTRTKFDLCV